MRMEGTACDNEFDRGRCAHSAATTLGAVALLAACAFLASGGLQSQAQPKPVTPAGCHWKTLTHATDCGTEPAPDERNVQYTGFQPNVDRSASTCPNTTLLGSERCLPHFLLIGAQKSGTSTIAELMAQHPQIVPPKRKELLFYMPDLSAQRFGQTGRAAALCHPFTVQVRNYLEEFGNVTPALYQRTGQITGEWSATYLACACCAFAAHSFTPKAKLIAILRHPIDRALSRYHEQRFFLTHFRKPVEVFNLRWPDFVAHYLTEFKRCAPRVLDDEFGDGAEGNFGQIVASDLDCSFANTAAFAVIGWSRYAPQLKPWLAAFGSSALLVLYTSDLRSDPARLLQQVEGHLGLAPFSYQNVNATYNGEIEMQIMILHLAAAC